MKKFYRNIGKFPLPLIILTFIIFFGGFFTYFHQDDFIHLSFSQSITEVINAFNLFQKGEFPFYRPIPTQLYFFIGKTLFGLNPLPYHIVNFIIFAVNIFIVYRLIILFTKNKRIAAISTLFFSINSTHFAPLYSAAYVHELLYVMFGVLTIRYFYLFIYSGNYQKLLISNLFFTLSLMSKETAVILPGIMILIYLMFSPNRKLKGLFFNLFPSIVILSLYLFGHFFYYGIAESSSYRFILGKSSLNILIWYFLWSLSTPNILIDFVGPNLKLNPVFWQVTGINGYIYFFLIGFVLVSGLILLYNFSHNLFKKSKKVIKILRPDVTSGLRMTLKEIYTSLRLVVFGGLWFIIGLIPLIIFPLHKLATQQAFSLIGLSLVLAVILVKGMDSTLLIKRLSFLVILSFVTISLNSVLLAKRTHWIVKSARVAKNTVDYMDKRYGDLQNIDDIFFINGQVKIPEYGSSKQVYQALGNGAALKLIYPEDDWKLYFEDINKPNSDLIDWSKTLIINSSQLLDY